MELIQRVFLLNIFEIWRFFKKLVFEQKKLS